MDEKPLMTACLRCGIEKLMTIVEALEHDDQCRKAKRNDRP